MGDEVFWAAFGGGAAAGVVILAADWFRWHLDRPLLKVELSLGNLMLDKAFLTSPTPNMSDNPLLIFTARNDRIRPVFIASLGLEFSEPKSRFRFWLSNKTALTGDWFQLPYEVTDGKGFQGPWSITTWFESLRQSGLEPKHVKKVWFLSHAGTRFSSRINNGTRSFLQSHFKALENRSEYTSR